MIHTELGFHVSAFTFKGLETYADTFSKFVGLVISCLNYCKMISAFLKELFFFTYNHLKAMSFNSCNTLKGVIIFSTLVIELNNFKYPVACICISFIHWWFKENNSLYQYIFLYLFNCNSANLLQGVIIIR